ncbi:MAG: antitoxin AF2212-like protein [Methanosarcinales archaeon]
MERTIEAIYKDGVFKPLERVELEENTEAKIIISENIKIISKKILWSDKIKHEQ